MNCPICGGKTKVIESRSDCEGVYRKRQCKECKYFIFTSELESDNEDFNRIMREIRLDEHNKNYNKNITKTSK